MTPPTRLVLAAGALASLAACSHHKHVALVAPPPPHAPLVLATDPKLVDMTVEPTSPLVLASATDELGIHVRIVGRALPDASRPPIDLALVLDTSGSMEGAAIDELKASADALVDKLRDGDRLALITFDSKVAEPMPSAVITKATRERAHHAIATIRARGTTDLQSGLAAAMADLSQRAHGKDLPRIVLLSDGVPNTATQLPTQLATIRASGYSVTTLGLGLDYDTTIMTKIAADTGGSFHYIEKPDQIAAVFDDELAKMTTVVARNLQLRLDAGPGVTIDALAGFTVQGSQMYATIGDLPAGSVRDLVIPIHVAARGEGSTAELVDATLTFTDVIANAGQLERDGFASAKTTKDQAAIAANIKIDLEVTRVRASAASAILEAMALARSGQIDAAKKRIADAQAAVKSAQTKLKTGELAATLAELANVSKEISQLVLQQAADARQRAAELKIAGGRPQVDMPQPQPTMAPPAVENSMRKTQEAATATVRGESPR